MVTEGLLCRLLSGIVSRESIRKALAACYENGQAIFCPPEHPPAGTEIPDGMIRQKNAFLSGGQKRTKPARLFRLPSPRMLCKALGLRARGGDPLNLEDLRSPKRYRQALHRALLQRRPGVYSQALLARRLGLSTRSIRRYNRALPLKIQPTYQETPVIWATLAQIPAAADLQRCQIHSGGQFLIDETGKKWPLKREIAAMLLAKGCRVSRMRQGCNHYAWESELAVQAGSARQALSVPPVRAAAGAEAPPQPPDFAPEAVFRPLTPDSPVSSPAPPAKRLSKRRFRKALPDSQAEYTAQRIHGQIDALSLPNARRLVETYGADIAAAALRKFAWLYQHRTMTNPAGYFVTLARVSWRARHPNTPAPRFQGEPPHKSRQDRYVPPEKDPLWQSPAYQAWRAEFFARLDDPAGEIVF